MKIIQINKDRSLNTNKIVVGYIKENNIEILKFEIPEEYQEYSKVACFKTEDGTFKKTFDDITTNYLTLTSDITQYNELDMSIEFIDSSNNIIARTDILHLIIKDSIISDDDVKADDTKVTILNELIDKVSKVDVELEDNILTITRANGEQKSVNVKGDKGEQGEQGIQGKQGIQGEKGNDAIINGVNTLNILAGTNINLEQTENSLKINSTQITPIILNKEEIEELHNLTPRMSDNQVFCESIYEKYGDGLFYVNSAFYLSNSTEDVTDSIDNVDIGSTIVVSNKGRSILVFTNSWYYTIKYYKCINTYADSNSRYSLATLTTEQLFDLINDESNLLRIDNDVEYTPTTDYQPTTKKYVDDKIAYERSIYYAEIFASNWYDKEVLQPILDLAYKGGYDDVFIKIKDGTRYIQCAGLSLQTLSTSSNSTFMWANLKYITGSSTTPNTIFYGYACANGVKLDENGDVSIDTTGLKQGSIKVMQDMASIDGYDATKTQTLKQVKGVLQWVE